MTALRLPAVAFTPSLTFEKCDNTHLDDGFRDLACCRLMLLLAVNFRYNYSGIYPNIFIFIHFRFASFG